MYPQCVNCFIYRFLNEKELEPSETIQMEVNTKDGICKLIISDATADMAGEIKAVAVNAGGEDLCSASLEVRGQAPTFIETPIKCTILEGKSCSVIISACIFIWVKCIVCRCPEGLMDNYL